MQARPALPVEFTQLGTHWHGSAGYSKARSVQESPWIPLGDIAQVFIDILGAENDLAAVCAMTCSAGSVKKAFPNHCVPTNYVHRDWIDVQAVVDGPVLKERCQLDHRGFI